MKLIYNNHTVAKDNENYLDLSHIPTLNGVDFKGDLTTETVRVTKWCTEEEYNKILAGEMPGEEFDWNTLYIVDNGNNVLESGAYNYDDLLNKPTINSVTLEGALTSNNLNMYTKDEVNQMLKNMRQFEVVSTLTNPQPRTLYYVGPDSEGLFDIIFVDSYGTQLHKGKTSSTWYLGGQAIDIDRAAMTISVKADGESIKVNADNEIYASLMTPCSDATAGGPGMVPGPAAGEQKSCLCGDGDWHNLIDWIYPIGSIYINVSGGVNPSILGGTWRRISEGVTLWNDAAGVGGGAVLAGSLPNITGTAAADGQTDYFREGSFTTGALKAGDTNHRYAPGFTSSYGNGRTMNFDASLSNSVYGAAAGTNVVRPTSISVVMWERIA